MDTNSENNCREKMTKRSAVLQTKLHELDSELSDIFRLSLDPTVADQRHQLSFKDIDQRFKFLEHLLSAEVASQPQASGELQKIGQKLTLIKAAFHAWKETGLIPAFDNHEDTLSICSDCTQALVCDDVHESSTGSPISEAEDFSGMEEVVEKDEEHVKKEGRAEERLLSEMGKFYGVFGCGMIVGGICMMNLLSSISDNFIEYEAFLLPPT